MTAELPDTVAAGVAAGWSRRVACPRRVRLGVNRLDGGAGAQGLNGSGILPLPGGAGLGLAAVAALALGGSWSGGLGVVSTSPGLWLHRSNLDDPYEHRLQIASSRAAQTLAENYVGTFRWRLPPSCGTRFIPIGDMHGNRSDSIYWQYSILGKGFPEV